MRWTIASFLNLAPEYGNAVPFRLEEFFLNKFFLDSDRRRYAKEMDVYNFGLILLEIIMGRPPVIEKALGEKPKIVEMVSPLCWSENFLA